MPTQAIKATTHCLNLALASPLTEQGARYKRILGKIADMRRSGARVITVNIADLEALIAIAACSDAGLLTPASFGIRALVAAAEEAGWDIGPNAPTLNAAREGLAKLEGRA